MTKLKSKRLLSLFVSLAMVFTLTATPVFATDTSNSGEVAVSTSTDSSEEAAEGNTYVAQIGSDYYSSLSEAINAVSSGQTITLLADVGVSETLQIFKSITLDLGDYTITSSASDKAIYTTQSLTITADTGGITATNGAAINNQKGSGTGTLTINGGTYTSSASHAIYNNNGTVIINSGTISATGDTKDGICCYSNATVTVNGGTISGTRYGIYSTYALTVNDGTISSTATDSKAGIYLNGGTAEFKGGGVLLMAMRV